jgi:hypothetical protein
MPDQVNIGFSPATAWNRIQIDADQATAAAEFKTAKAAQQRPAEQSGWRYARI